MTGRRRVTSITGLCRTDEASDDPRQGARHAMTLHRPIWLLLAAAASAAGCGFPGATPGIDADPPVTVGFRDPTSLEDEASGMVRVPVVLSEVTTDLVSVGFTVTGGSATAGDDFIAPAGTLSFAAGETEQTIQVNIVMDGLEEENETIVISLDNVAGALLGQSQHEVTINADILPRIYFTQLASNTPENGTTQFAIEMDMAADADVRVDYTVSGTLTGTPASAGADFMLAPTGTITIPMGMMAATLDLEEVDDQLDEEDVEGIVVTLSNADGVVIRAGEGVRTHDIADNDMPPDVRFAETASSQGESTAAGAIPVTLSAVSGRTVTVDYTVSLVDASTGDIVISNGSLSFVPGDTQEDIPLSVVGDTLDENNETVDLTLVNPLHANLPGSGDNHTFTIVDDDAEPSVSFQSAGQMVTENATTLNLVLVLSAVSGKDVSGTFGQGGGSTATSPGDYTFPATTFMIPAGSPSTTIAVTIVENTTSEPIEVLNVELTGATNASIGAANVHAVTINDDDPPAVSFDPAQSDGSANEGDSGTPMFTYDVVLSNPTTSTVTVDVAFTGSAMMGLFPADYTVGSGDVPVTFAPGDVRESIRLFIVTDNDNESGGSQRITMTLNNPQNAILVSPTVRNHDILDDD
jgi:hypothetical protein